MRRIGLALTAVLLAGPALAQQLPAAAPKVALSLTVGDVQLIVQALPLIGCTNVGQWAVCQHAVELLREIQKQARGQVK